MGLRFINEKILLFNLYLFSLRVFVPWWPSSYIFYLKKAAEARSNCNPTERALHERGRDSPADFFYSPSKPL